MSITDIKENLQKLSKEERREISKFLAQLTIAEDADYWSRIKRRCSDKNSDHWVPLEKIISPES
jgi:hypothetical protein